MRAPQVSEHRTVAADGGELLYYACGSGPLVLFINGLGGSFDAFRGQVSHLGDRYRCVGWDYRGVFADRPSAFGHVPAVADHAADALAILLAERATRAAVIAWSYGVQVALDVYRHAPDRVASLVLINGGTTHGWLRKQGAGPLRRRVATLVRLASHAPRLVAAGLAELPGSPESFTWARRVGLIGSGFDQDAFARVAEGLARVDVDVALATLDAPADPTLEDVPYTIDVPTLVIAGDRDPFTPRAATERLVHCIAGAEYLVLPGGTHYVQLDHEGHVNLRIDKFFAERGYASA